MWKVIPTQLLLKKVLDDDRVVYKPALKSVIRAKMILPVQVLKVTKVGSKSIQAIDHISEIRGESPFTYKREGLVCVYLKVDWLGKSINITSHPMLKDIVFSTHVIISKYGKIKKALYRL